MSVEEARITNEAVTVTAVRDGASATIVVEGEFDLASRSAWDTVVPALLSAGSPATRVDVDLRGVTFMDSSGLGILVRLLRWCETHEGRLRLTAISPNVRRILEYSGVDSVFELSATELEPD